MASYKECDVRLWGGYLRALEWFVSGNGYSTTLALLLSRCLVAAREWPHITQFTGLFGISEAGGVGVGWSSIRSYLLQ